MAGSKGQLNPIKGTSSAICATDAEMRSIANPLKRGMLIYNTTTKEIKVADGSTTLGALSDHRHPFTHAPLVHSHIHGANEPWLMSNPRLWYVDDLVNHPELLALDGSEITDDQAEYLSQVYPGTRLLTEKLTTMTSNGFENDSVTMSVDSYIGTGIPSALFNDEITIESLAHVTDQWLTTSADLNTAHSVTITFKGGHTYRPVEYYVVPAAGTSSAVFARRPTPKNWIFEGSDDGSTWTTLDRHTNEPAENWNPNTVRAFQIDTVNAYAMFRLTITAWNAGDSGLESGLRRLWIFGRKTNVFALPNIESPDPAFAYVVPYKDLNVGLKHEDVGDLGTTSVTPDKLASYRLPTDGSAYLKNNYDLLFAAIGHTCDVEATISSRTASVGSISGNKWSGGFTDVDLDSYVQLSMTSAGYVGKYKFDITNFRAPSEWTVEVLQSDGTWTAIQSYSGVTRADILARNGIFLIEGDYAEVANTLAVRFTFLAWNSGSESIGMNNIQVFTHPAGSFYVPTISVENATSYIVADLSATDVTPEVIQRLQNNVITLTNTLTALQNQVNAIDPNYTE